MRLALVKEIAINRVFTVLFDFFLVFMVFFLFGVNLVFLRGIRFTNIGGRLRVF